MNTRWLPGLLPAAVLLQACGSMLLGAPAPTGGQEPEKELRASLADETITADVRSALRLDTDLGRLPIWVETEAGVVTLTGTVESYALRDHAGRIASRVRNVQAVQNRLQVGSGSRFP